MTLKVFKCMIILIASTSISKPLIYLTSRFIANMADIHMPTWMKRGRENVSEDREQKNGRGKQNIHEQLADMISALQIAHISNDRETRENSGVLRTVALVFADSRGDLPKWVKQGIEENDAWTKDVAERPGENVGSPHVKVCLTMMHALLTSEELQQQKFEQPLRALKDWWKMVTKEGQAKENEVASEIKIFKIRGPPKRGSSVEEDEEMDLGSAASTASGRGPPKKVYARMEFVIENKEVQITLRKVLEQLGAEIKNGPAPCLRPTRKIKEHLKVLQRMGYGTSN